MTATGLEDPLNPIGGACGHAQSNSHMRPEPFQKQGSNSGGMLAGFPNVLPNRRLSAADTVCDAVERD